MLAVFSSFSLTSGFVSCFCCCNHLQNLNWSDVHFSLVLAWLQNLNMSNGSKLGSKREREDIVDKRADSRDFGSAISRIAVAQICESVGFERFNESALDSFADIAIKYLFDLGKTGTSYANLAGRSECNVFDIVRALEDLRRFLSPSQCHTFQWSKFLG
nr:transcription initiation factor tfiid subunit 8 [Ipomoea batatas]